MINLPNSRKTSTTNTFSQRCLPGGPRSATYDISNYTYYDENAGPQHYTLQPSILALDGDTQVGGYLYNSESSDVNYNRGTHPSPHTVTEKAFYTEVTPEFSQTFGPFGPVYNNLRNQTFLRVDLTEGGSVFRHNAIIVKGSVHCTTQRTIDAQSMQEGDPILYGLYDFEYYFVCQPLHSNFQPDGVSDTTYELLDRLKTSYNCYFYVRNRSFGDDSLTAVTGNTTTGITQHNPIIGGQSALEPNRHWAEFALASETGTNLDELNVVSAIQRPIPASDSSLKYVTPLQANLSSDSNEKWDLNQVNFKFAFPFLNQQPFGVSNRFAIKGTYLLI